MLKPLYAIAIAVLIVAFVGFGLSAFYPKPQYPGGYPDDERYSRHPTSRISILRTNFVVTDPTRAA